MNAELFVQNVKNACKERDIAPTTACQNAGVGKSFLADIKRGQTPSVAKVQALAEYLGVTTSELLGESAPEKISAPADPQTADALKIFDQLSPDQKTAALGFIEFLLSQKGEEK